MVIRALRAFSLGCGDQMKTRLFVALLTVVTLTQVACSKQWRENYVSVSSDQMLADLDMIAGDVAAASLDVQSFSEMAQDPRTTVYYASAPTMGPVGMIASILDFSFMYEYFSLAEVTSIRVFFLDFKDGDTHHNALLVDAELFDGTIVTDLFWGDGRVENGQFVVDLVSDDGAAGLSVKSNDVSKNSELNGTIQLKSYLPSGSYIGKFSTLVGFK